jgi:hypothetical protein
MRLNRQMITDQLYALNEEQDDPDEYFEEYSEFSDNDLIAAYCSSGLFSDNFPNAFESDIEGLE